jgi:hypothetical protein
VISELFSEKVPFSDLHHPLSNNAPLMRAALNTRDLSMGGFPFGRGARGGINIPLSVTLQPPKGLDDFKASVQVGLATLIGAMHQHEPVFRPTSEECRQILSALEQCEECDSCEVFHQLQRRLQVAEQVALFYLRHDRSQLKALNGSKWQAIINDAESWRCEVMAKYGVCAQKYVEPKTQVPNTRSEMSEEGEQNVENALTPAQVREAVELALHAPSTDKQLPISEALKSLQQFFALEQLPKSSPEESEQLQSHSCSTLRGVCWKVMVGGSLLPAGRYVEEVELGPSICHSRIMEDISRLGVVSGKRDQLIRTLNTAASLTARGHILRQGVDTPIKIEKRAVYVPGMASGEGGWCDYSFCATAACTAHKRLTNLTDCSSCTSTADGVQ